MAVWADDPATATDAEVRAAMRAAGKALRKAGATVSEAARPEIDQAQAFRVYLGLVGSVLFSHLPPEEDAAMRAAAAALRAGDGSSGTGTC